MFKILKYSTRIRKENRKKKIVNNDNICNVIDNSSFACNHLPKPNEKQAKNRGATDETFLINFRCS